MATIPRLKRRSEFLRVAGKGRKWATQGVVVQALPRAPAEEPKLRVGFTASKKVGGAVDRNRAKRRLRAAAEAILPAAAPPHHDFVLIARAETVTRGYADLLADLRAAVERLGRPPKRRSDAA